MNIPSARVLYNCWQPTASRTLRTEETDRERQTRPCGQTGNVHTYDELLSVRELPVYRLLTVFEGRQRRRRRRRTETETKTETSLRGLPDCIARVRRGSRGSRFISNRRCNAVASAVLGSTCLLFTSIFPLCGGVRHASW